MTPAFYKRENAPFPGQSGGEDALFYCAAINGLIGRPATWPKTAFALLLLSAHFPAQASRRMGRLYFAGLTPVLSAFVVWMRVSSRTEEDTSMTPTAMAPAMPKVCRHFSMNRGILPAIQ